jgi:hypothetical protein
MIINQLKLISLIRNTIKLATTWSPTLKTPLIYQKIDKPPTYNISRVG